MAFASKAVATTPATRVVRMAPVKALPNAEKIQVAAVSAAVAIALTATPAFAGVQFENQPQVRKAFQTAEKTEVVKKAPAARAAKKEATESSGGFSMPSLSMSAPSSSLNVQSLWPVGVVASVGSLFAFAKFDTGFGDFLGLVVRDSNVLGAGTEETLKGQGGMAAAYYEEKGATPPTTGTKLFKKKTGKK